MSKRRGLLHVFNFIDLINSNLPPKNMNSLAYETTLPTTLRAGPQRSSFPRWIQHAFPRHKKEKRDESDRKGHRIEHTRRQTRERAADCLVATLLADSSSVEFEFLALDNVAVASADLARTRGDASPQAT